MYVDMISDGVFIGLFVVKGSVANLLKTYHVFHLML